MSKFSDYTETTVDEGSSNCSDFKQNFDLVSPEEIQYYSELLVQDFEELNRKSCIFGLQMPQTICDMTKWMEENLNTQLHLHECEPTFFHNILVNRKVMKMAIN
jgi:hypothetical protein